MTQASQRGPFSGFNYQTPRQHETVTVGRDGKIEVTVTDLDQGQATYTASISSFLLGSGTGAPIDSGPLLQQGSTNLYSARLSVGPFTDPPTGVDNRFVSVTSSISGTFGHPFRVIHGGSGSGSQTLVTTAARCEFIQADQPVPAVLSLQLDTPVAEGDCADCGRLNQPTLLAHGQDAGYECCWLSEPVDFCCDPTSPGFWMLRRSDARTWDLLLRRGLTDIASYRLLTEADGECSFPITLQLLGAGDDCANWPCSVTLSPAP